MTKTTKLIKQNDDVYHIDIPEEYVSRLGWENGYLLKIDVDDNKIVIEKLSGFMGMWLSSWIGYNFLSYYLVNNNEQEEYLKFISNYD